MRLKHTQIEQIHEALRGSFQDVPYQLFLYGSRTQDDGKGGDIDLLILTNEEGVEHFDQCCLDILVAIKKMPAIGQRRIDLKAALAAELTRDPFLRSIQNQLMPL